MGEPLAITFKEVQRAYKDKVPTEDAWRKIGEITGAGHVPAGPRAAIDLTEASDSVRERVAKIVADGEAKAEEAQEAEVKKGGKK